MILSLNSFATLVQSQAAAVQASARSILDFTVGSVVRAIIEANASVALWMQWLILQVLSMTRAGTSVAADLDTWMADFSLARLAATQATGTVTLSRFTATSAVQVAPGSQVKTADGSQIFTVVADAAQGLWNAGLGVYVIPAATASGAVTVQAVSAGIQGNVAASTITLIASAIPVDTVTNGAAFTNGVDAETDAAFRTRFAQYIQTRSRATTAAVGAAINGVQQNLTYAIQENVSTIGAYQPGNFVVIVDDGSGSPPAPLLTSVSTAIAAVRPVGSTWAVFGPTAVPVTIILTIDVSAGTVKANLLAPVATAITTWVNALPIGGSLPWSRIAAIAYGVDPGIIDVRLVTINGATTDVSPGVSGAIVVSSVTVN